MGMISFTCELLLKFYKCQAVLIASETGSFSATAE